MTVDRLIDLLPTINPGFFMIAAGLLLAVVRPAPLRALVMVGGPAAALVALAYSPGFAVDIATAEVFGLELVLYRADSLSAVFGVAFMLASAIGGIYSLHRRDWVQDSTALIYGGAAVTAVFVGDLISLFIAWELTAIASVFQVLGARTPESGRAAMRYLAFQVGSGLLLLAGASIHLAATGDIAFAQMSDTPAALPVGVLGIDDPGAVLILAAFGIKAAFPMVHNWLQDAYPKATETGAVILSAFTTKLAVYALARYFAGLDILIWIGAVMTVFPVFFAVIENDLRKVLSYSLNNQVGFMVCAVGIGTELAINGAAAHAFAHIMYKALLFMSMGAVLLRTGTTKVSELGGLHRTMPWTTLFCLIGAASISAFPFFSGFAAKSMVMSASHQDATLFTVWLMLLFASAGVLEHSGIKVPYFAFFSHDSGRRPQEAPFNMLLAMGLAAAISVGIGVSPEFLYAMLPYRDAAASFLAHELWTSTHVIQQLQLLIFATLAFMALKYAKLYPPERPGVIVDVEWIWRKGLPQVSRALARPVAAPVRILSFLSSSTGRGVLALGRHVFASGGLVSARVPLAATAMWTLAILGFVMLVSFLA